MSDLLRMTGLNSGMDTESIVSALVSAKKVKVDEAKQAQKKLEWTQDAWKGLNSKIYNLYSTKLSSLRFSTAYNKKATTTSNSALSVVATENSVKGVQAARITSLSRAGYMTGADLSESYAETITGESTLSSLGIAVGSSFNLKVGTETKNITVTDGMTMQDLTAAFAEAGVNANFDEGNQRMFISATKTGIKNDFELTAANADGDLALASLGLTTASGAKILEATDAAMTLNGVNYTSDTNTFVINNSTYTANAICDTQDITITTSADVSGIYDMICDFFDEYNSAINEMAKMYNADSSKGYEPLTDEQRESMTDTQIEDWEKKIKDSLLRHDSTLSGVLQAMRTKMSEGAEVNGVQMYLSDFGIATQGYFQAAEDERYAYHIEGNKKDSVYAEKDDVLRSMIASNPETVVSFFTQLANSVYTELSDKMASSDYSSIYKVYNDKKMKTDYDNYTKRIAELEDKLSAFEDKYYKKFSVMETSLAKMNSNQSAITSLLGQ